MSLDKMRDFDPDWFSVLLEVLERGLQELLAKEIWKWKNVCSTTRHCTIIMRSLDMRFMPPLNSIHLTREGEMLRLGSTYLTRYLEMGMVDNLIYDGYYRNILRFPNLKRLVWSKRWHFNFMQIGEVVRGCKNLQTLTVELRILLGLLSAVLNLQDVHSIAASIKRSHGEFWAEVIPGPVRIKLIIGQQTSIFVATHTTVQIDAMLQISTTLNQRGGFFRMGNKFRASCHSCFPA